MTLELGKAGWSTVGYCHKAVVAKKHISNAMFCSQAEHKVSSAFSYTNMARPRPIFLFGPNSDQTRKVTVSPAELALGCFMQHKKSDQNEPFPQF